MDALTKDALTIGGRTLTSRFFLGTASYPSPQILQEAIAASGAEVVWQSWWRGGRAAAGQAHQREGGRQEEDGKGDGDDRRHAEPAALVPRRPRAQTAPLARPGRGPSDKRCVRSRRFQ